MARLRQKFKIFFGFKKAKKKKFFLVRSKNLFLKNLFFFGPQIFKILHLTFYWFSKKKKCHPIIIIFSIIIFTTDAENMGGGGLVISLILSFFGRVIFSPEFPPTLRGYQLIFNSYNLVNYERSHTQKTSIFSINFFTVPKIWACGE